MRDSNQTSADPAVELCAERLRALAAPIRLRILRTLDRHRRQGARVYELQSALAIPQALISHHLGRLREAQLVERERDGKGVRYRLAADVATDPDTVSLGCCRLSFEHDFAETR